LTRKKKKGRPPLNPLTDEKSLIEKVRPKRLDTILALRACRKAIMVGDILTKDKMRDVVDHLQELKKPWICAHGRPTMRYLLNIDEYRQRFMDAEFKSRRQPPKIMRKNTENKMGMGNANGFRGVKT
jgi:hypothetical protein